MITKKSRIKIIAAILFCTPFTMAQAQNNDPFENKIQEVINKMSLEEKIGMIHANSSFTSAGVERLGIPELVMSDGPHGVRMEHGRDWIKDFKGDDSATYLPTGITLAATWNPELGYAFGKVLGTEAKYRGKDVILGPGINIQRTPLNGRNFEYLSEDPYLISQMAVGYIKGVQDQGISACVKHYLANNQEFQRDSINVEMSERALREIYLPGFVAAVKDGGVHTLMGAYNKFRGEYCTHNEYLINQILRKELGFKGVVISDWGAVHNTFDALTKGTDIEMGTDLSPLVKNNYQKFYLADAALAMVKSGKVKEEVVNEKVKNILRLLYTTKLATNKTPGAINTKEHQETALKIAQEAIVLLKNDAMLPLKKEIIKNILVIGDNATRKHAGAGGSSQVLPKYEITPLEGIRTAAGSKIKVSHLPGYQVTKSGKGNPALLKEAVAAAAKAELVIIVGGWMHGYSDEWDDNAFDAENIDKPSMQLPFGQNELFNAVLKANQKTIIILNGGGPMDMTGWGEKSKAIVQAWYPGMEGGKAIAQIIFGDINPSGKLPLTFPVKLEDSPAHKIGEYPGNGKTVNYKEGIFVGYRYFDTYKVAPLYPFGHGLSYTTFEFSDLIITPGSHSAVVKVNVKNTGPQAGAEVVQVYVKDIQASVERPEKELKSFKKIFLNPGESKVLELKLDENAFHFYDENKKQWVVEPGNFEIQVGSSSRNIKLKKEITI